MSAENDFRIFINEDLIKKIPRETPSYEKKYFVNGEAFFDHQDTSTDTDYHVFEIYSLKNTEEGNIEEMEAMLTMEISLTPMPYGFIINGSIYLPEHQWHTIIFIDITMLHCAVCDFYTQLSYVSAHIDTEAHTANLDLHKPLLEYDLSITRKIRNKYHCGVCNEIFKISESEGHFNGKRHEDNLLFAVNKATDVMCDDQRPGNQRKDVYHYNEHNMNSGTSSIENRHENASESSSEYYSGEDKVEDNAYSLNQYRDIRLNVPRNEEIVVNNNNFGVNNNNFGVNNNNFGASGVNNAGRLEESMRKFIAKNLNFGQVKDKEFDIPEKAKNDKDDQFWDNDFEQDSDEDVNNMGSTSNDDNDTEQTVTAEDNDNYFKQPVTRNIDYCKGTDHKYPKEAFGNNKANYEDIDKYFDFEDEFYDVEALYSSSSYANMAKKPKEIEEIIEVDFGEKRVKVNFDSWHMIIYPKANCFYCMACKAKDHISLKLEHCKSDKHIDFLTNCRVVKSYTDHFIRKVDEKFYHCGHCNCIQYINYIDEHIDTEHAKKPGNKNKKGEISCSSTPIKSRTQSRNYDSDRTPNISRKHSENESSSTDFNNLKNNRKAKDGNNDHNRYNDIEHNDKTNRSTVDTSVNKSYVNNIHDSVVSNKTDVNDNISKNNSNLERKIEISNNINDNIVILPFGYKITVSKLSYNIICDKVDNFYCALCNVTYKKEMLNVHLQDLNHLAILCRTPFIMPFSYHLIRALREALHCAICNCPVLPGDIYTHIENPHHKSLLHIALNINPAPNKLDNEDNADNENEHSGDNDTEHNGDNDNEVTIVSEDNGLINDTLNTTTEDLSFDFEEYVYLKLKNNFVRVSNSSYHTLVSVGDGSRYCFVCATPVIYLDILKHVESRPHVENMEKNMFLEKYEDHLLRQIYLVYHCSVCNALVNKKDLKTHLDWSEHTMQNETWSKNIKVSRRNEMKGGVREIVVSTQKEKIYFGNSPNVRVLLNVTTEKIGVTSNGAIPKKKDAKIFPSNLPDVAAKSSTNTNVTNNNTVINNGNTVINNGNISKQTDVISSKSLPVSSNNSQINTTSVKNTMISSDNTLISSDNKLISNPELKAIAKKSKMIILKDTVYVVPWENWNSIAKIKNGYKCNICQMVMPLSDVSPHCETEWHNYALNKPLDAQYAPALIRKINEATLLNCLVCNTEFPNQEHLVSQHINGKRHIKNYDAIIKNSSQTDAYQACGEEILTIDSR